MPAVPFSNQRTVHRTNSMFSMSTRAELISKAKFTNFGYVVEQEGDSFSVAFEEAKDAVQFCLQVQQMLTVQQWPAGLFEEAEGLSGQPHHQGTKWGRRETARASWARV